MQRIPAPWPEPSREQDAAATAAAILAEIAATLTELGARLDAARALLSPASS